MTPEGKVVAAIVKLVKSMKMQGEPIRLIKLRKGPYQESGLPDLLIIYRGVPLAVEGKAPGEEPTMLQVHVLNELKYAGARTLVAESVEQAQMVLREIKTNKDGT